MRKAVLCFAHKSPELLNVQLTQLLHNTDSTDIYIHLDLKSMWMKDKILSNEHIFFIKQNVSVIWGDDSMMRALYNSWKEIRESGRNYDYFIMTTGQDLIVRPDLDTYLQDNYGKIWIDAKYQDDWRRMVLSYKFPTIFCRDLSANKYILIRAIRSLYYRMIKYGLGIKRDLNFDLNAVKFYYSFNWSIMPYYVFEYCAQYIEENVAFKELYLNTILPEDGFLGTLIMNSPYRSDVVMKNNVTTDSNTYHSVFSVHPKVLTYEDINEIELSGCFFARKFDDRVDMSVIKYFQDKIKNS